MMPRPKKGELVFTVEIWSWKPSSCGGSHHHCWPPSVEMATPPPSQLNSVQTQERKERRAVALLGTVYSSLMR